MVTPNNGTAMSDEHQKSTQAKKGPKTPGRVATADQALEAKANAQLAKRLAEARETSGLGACELDLLIGATPGTIQGIEDGEHVCSAAALFQIARVLGRPGSYFFAGLIDDDDNPAADTPDMIKAREFAEAFITLENPSHRKAILEFVRAMSQRPTPDPKTPKN